MHAAASAVRASTAIATAILRRALPLAILAAAMLAGGSLATSREAQAEWWGYCGGGGSGYQCDSVAAACESIGQPGNAAVTGVVIWASDAADCYFDRTPFKVLTRTYCPGGYLNNIGRGPGCQQWEEPEDLGPCATCGGTATDTGSGSPAGPVGGTGDSSAGNPLTLSNGNKFQAVTDYRSSGPDALAFTRYYNSLSWINSFMGMGWRNNFQISLQIYSSTGIWVHRPNGRIENFTSADGNNPWNAVKGGIVGKLAKTADGWTYTRVDDTVETYDAAGRLLSIARKNGYTQSIEYGAGGVSGAWAVNDSHGRTLMLYHTYYGAGPGWRLKRLVDPDGRVYTYNYRSVTSYNLEPWILDEVVYPDETPDPAESEGVSLLSHFDGANGERFAPDESLGGHLLRFNYPARIDTAQGRFGGASARFENTLSHTSSVSVADSDDWHFGAAEFTVEAWVQFSRIDRAMQLFSQWVTDGDLSWVIDRLSDGQLRFVYSTDGTAAGTAILTANWTPAVGAWHHVAVDRDSAGRLRVYVDGNVVIDTVVTAAFHNSTAGLSIGAAFVGWIDEPRIDKGAARYAGAFTPPTAPYPGLRGDNPRQTYQFEDPALLYGMTGMTDETGQRTATWSYNEEGRGLSSEHAGGVDAVTLAHNADGTKTLTNPLGKQFTYSFATIGLLPRITRIDRLASVDSPAAAMIFGYDANSFVNSATDWKGVQTTYQHNARGLQESRTEAFGTPEQRTTTTQWHPDFRVPTQIAAPERTTDMAYYPDGLLHTRTVTDATTHTVPYSTNGQTRTWTYTYDAVWGQVETVDGPRTDVVDVTTYAWDPVTGDLTSVTNAAGHVTQITDHDASGRPLKTLDANGVETTLAYDVRGRLRTRTVDSGAGGTPAVTTFAYDDAGQMTGMTLPDGSTLTYEYDDADRLGVIVNDLGERIEYGYDDMGNRTGQTVKAADATIVRTATATFDDLGRMLRSIGAYAGEETVYAYDANSNTISVTDPLSNVTGSGFDALNRLVTVTDALTNTAGYAYDAAGNRETATDQRGLATAYVHNGFGEVIQQSSPDTGVAVYEYDSAGNRTQRTDARGVVTDWTYDALGRVATMTFPASAAENVTYAYDDATPSHYGIGRLASVTDDSGATGYRYDARGNTVRVESVIGAQTYVTQYAWDTSDRLVQMVYPSGVIVDYARDPIGRVTGVTTRENELATPETLATGATYQAFGPLDGLVHGNGHVLTRGYDLDGRIEAIVTDNPGAAQIIQDLAYGYDLAGNIETIADAADPVRSQTFGYDELYRLTAATGAYGVYGYGYDAVGNRTTRTADAAVTTYGYDAFSNRLETVTSPATVRVRGYSESGATVSYANGTGKLLQTALYDSTDRLVKAAATKGGTLGKYAHNALGQRVAKRVDGVTTHFIYDLSGQLIAEHDEATGDRRRFYVRLDGMLLGGAKQGQPGTGAIHVDHLGTPQKVTDAAGAVVWDAVYRPFGKTESIAGPLTFNLRFPGQYYDAETKLHHNYFRDYDPKTGRYVESDPIGLRGGWNTYVYVGGNPVMRVDPEGLEGFGGDVPGGPTPKMEMYNWVGLNLEGSYFLMFTGLEGGAGFVANLETGEECDVAVLCWKVGLGMYIGGGVKGNISLAGPKCGKDLAGTTRGFAAEGAWGTVGGGGSLTLGSGLGTGFSIGPNVGYGGSGGYLQCETAVISCTDTPCECQ